MGTSVSSLQIMGASLEDVRAALPRALVGQWSARFVTACPNMAFQSLERKASALSKKLACTVLSASMFDGDMLSLVVYQSGKRLTRHVVDPERGENIAGNPKLFCAALGLPEELAPKLKRLFTACEMQEEKLGVLQTLLGAPLFLRYGDDEEGHLPEGPVEADSGPLEKWIEEHPVPPRVKNQCRAEVIQEETLLPTGPFPISNDYFFQGMGGFLMFSSLEEEEELPPLTLWRTAPDGTVYLWKELPDVEGDWGFGFSVGADRLFAFRPGGETAILAFDSMDVFSAPLALKGIQDITAIESLPNGGLAFWDIANDPDPDRRGGVLSLMDPDGHIRNVQFWTEIFIPLQHVPAAASFM